jgi:hypothetical protein
LVEARGLGPISGRLGHTLAYIIAGCLPNLNYQDAAAAFDRVAAIGRGGPIDAGHRAPTEPPPTKTGSAVGPPALGEQLCLPGLPPAAPPARLSRKTRTARS